MSPPRHKQHRRGHNNKRTRTDVRRVGHDGGLWRGRAGGPIGGGRRTRRTAVVAGARPRADARDDATTGRGARRRRVSGVQSLTRVLKIRVSCIRVLAGYVFVYVFSCIY